MLSLQLQHENTQIPTGQWLLWQHKGNSHSVEAKHYFILKLLQESSPYSWNKSFFVVKSSSYSSTKKFPPFPPRWSRPLCGPLTGGRVLFALSSLSEDNGSTKPTLKLDVYSFHGTKLLDSLQKGLPDYLVRSKNSLYKAPETV